MKKQGDEVGFDNPSCPLPPTGMLVRQTKIRGLGFGVGLCAALSLASLACGGKSDDDLNGSQGAAGGEGGRASTGGSGGRSIGTAANGGSAASTGSNDAGSNGEGTGGSGSTGSGGTLSVGTGGTGGDTLPAGVCSNGLDDDGDGLVDGFDPECIGPLDNDEGSFATGIPGDNRDPKWQDCFFDGNSGAGDDDCRYATSCLYGDTAQEDPACTVTEQCLDYCGARTPNGCDCFGCCTVGLGNGESVDVYTTSTCSLDQLADEEACPRCTKSTACVNDCGECELCPGKTVEDLPDSCGSVTPPVDPPDGGSAGAPPDGGGDPPPPIYTCDEGVTVCSVELPCSGDFYCQFGCCVPTLVR
jgi:hypothetical protein